MMTTDNKSTNTKSGDKHPVKKKQTNSFKTYIHRVLNSIDTTAQISVPTIEQIDKLTRILARRISATTRARCIQSKKKTIFPSEVVLAVDLMFPAQLAAKTVEFIKSTAETYTRSEDNRGTHEHPVRRETLANLLFSVALSEKFLRQSGASNLHVGKLAPVALAACLEFIVRNILSLSIDRAREMKRIIVKTRHVYLAVQMDDNLSVMFQNLNLELMNGGSVPCIREELLPSEKKKMTQAARRRKNKKTQADGTKKPHRFLPGTKALRDIKHYQKTTDTLLQRTPFEKNVRAMGETIKRENSTDQALHFGGGTIRALQSFVEQKVTNLLSRALTLTIHRGRDSLNADDVRIAWQLTESNISQTENQLDHIGDNGIERLARRAGVKRISSTMFPVVRSFMYSLVYEVLYRCCRIIDNFKIMTIGIQHLEDALESLNVYFTIPSKLGRTKKTKKKEPKEENPAPPAKGKKNVPPSKGKKTVSKGKNTAPPKNIQEKKNKKFDKKKFNKRRGNKPVKA